MITAEEAERLAITLAEKSDREVGTLFLVNLLPCALSGGKRADTPFARLHKALVEEINRRGMKANDELN